MDQSGNPLPESKKRGAPRGNRRALGNTGGGRKLKFKSAFIGVARKACERGFTDQEVADLLGVNASTFYRWRVQYPQFARVVRLGKEMADVRVERSLYERAIGYSYEAQKAVMTRHGQEILRWREHLPPDVGAAMAYLKNRRPDRWRDTRRIEHTRSPYDHIESAAELRVLLQKQAQQLGLIPPPIISMTPREEVLPEPTAQKATDEAPGNDIGR
jgi:transposase-like protein